VPVTWLARFITPSAHPPGVAGTPAPYLRREFTVGPGLREATLHLTALGLIEAYLNGRRVGDDLLAPGWTAYDARLVVSSHDVTGMVTEGTNGLGAILGEGWAVGRLTFTPETRNLWADRPAGFLQLELRYDDHTDVVVSDESWRAGLGAVGANSIYDGETHDARLEPSGWSEAGFDDSGWSSVDLIHRDPLTLIPRLAPPIRRIELLPARSVSTTPQGHTVVDFGQVLTGWVRLAVSGPAGTTITIRHCEAMIGGEPEFATNVTALNTDRYTLRGGGTEVWEPRFTFHGFRYAVVTGWPTELSTADLTAVVIHTDLARTGWFECSDELVNRLHRNVVWSMRGNFVGLPTDCPQRDERLGWTGDINAFAPTATFLYDVADMLGSWLEDLAAEQRVTKLVPWVVPDVIRQLAGPTALWADVAVSLPWQLYWTYGDRDRLAAQYESMVIFIDSVERQLSDDGLWDTGFQFGDWLDPDAPPGNASAGKTDPYLVATAYLCRTTTEIAKAADVLGHVADVERYTALHRRVRAAFRRAWVTPEGRLTAETATAYSLAICFGILDSVEETTAGERLAEIVAEGDYRIRTGFAGTPLVAHALSGTGQLDTAYRLLLQTECPSFLYPVTQGATTVWERWDAIRPDGTLHPEMTSLNHYALGAIADWLHCVVGGLNATEPGYSRMRIAPKPGGGLTHATTTLDTRHGQVRVSWRRAGELMTVDVGIPAGTRAEVELPSHPDRAIEAIGAGHHTWEYVATPAVRS
jgi:alpha-L-rhamnosidase